MTSRDFFHDLKGSAAVVALIITAVSVTMMSTIGNMVITMVAETMPKESIPAFIQENTVKLVNPSSVSVDLSKMKVLVSGNQISLRDENGNEIWEKSESLFLEIPQTDSAIVEVYYDDKLIYKAVYIKPLPIHADAMYPNINIGENQITATDDIAVLALQVFAGSESGESLIYGEVFDYDKALGCLRDYEKTGEWKCRELSEKSLQFSVEVNNTNPVRKNVSIGNVTMRDVEAHYFRFVAFDASGKPASVVRSEDGSPSVAIERITPLSQLYKIMEDSQARFRLRTPLSYTNLDVTARAVDDFGLMSFIISLDGTSQNCSINSRFVDCTKTFSASIGNHLITATANDSDGNSNTASRSLEIVKDNPPSVTITKPQNQDTFQDGSRIDIEVNATDDYSLSSVEILINGSVAVTCPVQGIQSNCTHSATLSVGDYTVDAVARDDLGQETRVNVTFRVVPASIPTPTPTPNPTPTPTPTPSPAPMTGIIKVPEVSWERELAPNIVVTS